MKNTYSYLLSAFLFLTACRLNNPATTDPSSFPIQQNTFTWKDANSPNFPKVSAHRGGMEYDGYPENALETIQYVFGNTGAIIECDIAMTEDGQLILMHDNSLERTTTCDGKVGDHKWQELQSCSLEDADGDKTPCKIPLLEDLLDWADEKGVLFTLDIKRGVPYEKVLDMVRKYNYLDRAAIITYDLGQAMKIHRLEPDAYISATIRNEEELQNTLSSNIPLDRLIAFTGTREKDRAFFKKLDDLGIPAIFGTIGNLDNRAKARGDGLYKDFINDGVDILATNRPLEAYIATQKKN